VNREHKLALIIGFSLVLVVGVLISDHLSRARLASGGEVLAMDDSGRVEVLRAEPLVPEPNVPLMPGVVFHGGPGEAQIVREDAPLLAQAPLDGAGEPVLPGLSDALAMQATNSESRPEPLVISQGRAAGGEPVVRDPDRDLIDEISRFGGRVLARGEHLREIELPTLVERDRVPSDRVDTISREPVTTGERTQTPAPRAEPLRHVVQANESLYRIAAKHLGDGNRWREIARANEGKVDDQGNVRVGVSLVIPGKTVAVSTPPQAGSSTPVRLASEKPAATSGTQPKAPARGERVYVVKSGDSLGKIAQNELGTVKRMKEIVELNKLDDDDTIFVGMRLKLPS
jgi:nucleoid-associated protein YgaU